MKSILIDQLTGMTNGFWDPDMGILTIDVLLTEEFVAICEFVHRFENRLVSLHEKHGDGKSNLGAFPRPCWLHRIPG